jgi:transcription termination/antitermination protein NusG
MTLAWFALRTRSRFEFAVRDQFRATGIEEFLPVVMQESRWTDRTVQVTRPLFPGYIFVRCAPGDLLAVLMVRGVVQILGMVAGEPESVSDSVIADLRRAVESPTLSLCAYVAGETVTIARGPFAGVTGVVIRVKGAATLTIPVEILGRSVSVAIDVADVE